MYKGALIFVVGGIFGSIIGALAGVILGFFGGAVFSAVMKEDDGPSYRSMQTPPRPTRPEHDPTQDAPIP